MQELICLFGDSIFQYCQCHAGRLRFILTKQRSFQYIGPVMWNSLSFSVRHATTLSSFKSKLKTHLFSSAYWFLAFFLLFPSNPWLLCLCFWGVCVCVGGWSVCGCVCVCGSGMLICFVSALGSHEMGRHKLPIIIIILLCAPLSRPSSCMLMNHGPSRQSSKDEYKPWKWGATARYYTSHTKTMLPTRKSVPRSSRQLDHTKISWRSQRDANWSNMVMFPVHQVWPKPSCKAQWKGEEDKADRGRGGKTSGMDRPGVRQVPEGSGEREKWKKTGCKIICGAPTTLAVKGLMMMMMMMMRLNHIRCPI